MRLIVAALIAGMLGSVAASAPTKTKPKPEPTSPKKPHQPPRDEKPNPKPPKTKTSFKGTARCTAECTLANGQKVCKPVDCSVSGCLSREDAERRLKTMIEGKVRHENGKIQGEISFSISVDF